MTCEVRVIDGRRFVCFAAPTEPAPPEGFVFDEYTVESKAGDQKAKTIDEAAALYGDRGPEHADLVAWCNRATHGDDATNEVRYAEWSNARGSWGPWKDA